MNVILLEKVKNLGDLGDTVKVKSGYGRNFLLPKGKALPATESNRKVFDSRKAELVRKATDSLNAARMRAEKIAGLSVNIRALASEEGKLYGSVGPAEIVAAANAAGAEIQKSEIDVVSGHIRATGSFTVGLRFHSEVETSITVVVQEQRGS